MNILEFINPFWFIIAFGIGILLNYISIAPPKTVIKYPTPDNSNKIIYKDTAETCYKYNSKEVDCPKDTNKIEFIKIQHVENNENEKESILTKIKKNFFDNEQ
jgi:hypothetical protein